MRPYLARQYGSERIGRAALRQRWHSRVGFLRVRRLAKLINGKSKQVGASPVVSRKKGVARIVGKRQLLGINICRPSAWEKRRARTDVHRFPWRAFASVSLRRTRREARNPMRPRVTARETALPPKSFCSSSLVLYTMYTPIPKPFSKFSFNISEHTIIIRRKIRNISASRFLSRASHSLFCFDKKIDGKLKKDKANR